MELPSGIKIPEDKIAQFCKKWAIVKLELFGSALTKEFNAESDIDFLATFDPDSKHGLESYLALGELSQLFSRKVDLVSKQALLSSRNKYRSQKILSKAILIYDRT
ncbi:MAG: nucleotidyltransferase domain-containing protein [Leptospiraceae bacterium]|nr:nucleotidyltransferase domain-containing protein [Leptospiraceae bacterium]